MKHSPTAAEFNPLIELFNARRYAELENQVRALLVKHPRVPFAWQLLGGALQMQGKDALAAFQKVVELSSNDAHAHFNLGVAFKSTGQLEEAVKSYRHALVIKPNYVQALSNLGSVLQDIGQLNEAVQCYQHALTIQPNVADTHNNLGTALKDLGQLNDAAACYRQAIQLKPDYADAHYNLGNILKKMGQLEAAVHSYQAAVHFNPPFTAALSNLSSTLYTLGLTKEALIYYQRMAVVNPESAEAHNNLGLIFYELKQFPQAFTSCQQALALRPDYAEAHNHLGMILKATGQFDNAITSYRRAIACDPNLASAYSNLGNLLKEMGQYKNAITQYRLAIALQPDFAEAHNNLGFAQIDLAEFENAQTSFRQALTLKPDYLDAHSNLLFALNYCNTHPKVYLTEALRYGKMAVSKVSHRYTTWQCESHPQRLRVGFVSADLRNHPVGFFLEGLVAAIDSSQIELIAYSNSTQINELTQRIQPHFSQWRTIYDMNDAEVAQHIHADNLHVLIDLSGHTAGNRLPVFAWKPAPIQVSWLGYFAATGLAEMDYVLADATGVLENQRENFNEQVWFLSETRLCFTPPDTNIPITPLPSLSRGYVTFGCFQNLAKLGEEVLATWGHIFTKLPDARLRLACKQLEDPAVIAELRQRLKQHGIDPDRITMCGSVTRAAYLATYAEVDILLDTFPYPGGTTTCEGLWMGVPTLTFAGHTLLERQGASLLTAAKLPDWIANSVDEYADKAVSFATDLTRLAVLRAALREQVRASPLFDAPRFARLFEAAMWEMWRKIPQAKY